MRHLARELHGAVRGLARSPLFATVAVLSLGIALALNTTMFALVDAILHPPMPHPAPERLYQVNWRGDDPRKPVPPEDKHRAIVEGLTAAEATATLTLKSAQLVVNGDGADGYVAAVGPGFFAVTQVRPVAGRTLDGGSPTAREAVIEYGMWRRAFGERPLSERLTIEIDEEVYTVVGVMPPGMRLGAGEVWIPIGSIPGDSAGTMRRMGTTALRARPGVTRAMLEAELKLVARRVQAEHGSPEYPLGAFVWGVVQSKPRLDGFHQFLLIVVGGVLAIACANLATLLLARGAARRREMAVRLAMGARRWTVARQVLLECGLIAFAGAALGLLLTQWGMRLVAHWAPPFVPQLGEFVPHTSWRVFAFAFGVALGVMVLAGVLPALRAASVPPAEPLKDGAGTTRRRRERYSGLVVAEVALSTALLMLAGLGLMSNWRLARYEFGFDARRLLNVGIYLPRVRGSAITSAARMPKTDELLARLRSVPGVRDVATVRGQGPDGPIVIGENGRAGERWMNLRTFRVVSPSYLRTMGLPVVQGRDFSEGDASGTEPVAIVDQAAARRLWPEFASPVGRMLKTGDERSDALWVRVVGVTPSRGRRPDAAWHAADDPDIYLVLPNDSMPPLSLVVATRTDAASMPLAIRRELRRTLGQGAGMMIEPYRARFDENLRFTGFLAMLFCALSAFALVLCAVGLYGVLAYTVSQRTREFAIRIALGARAPTVARLVVHDASVMALAGVGIGAFVALAFTYGMATEFDGIRWAHAKALVAAEAVLFAAAMAAAWEPVRRGMRANPASTMQSN